MLVHGSVAPGYEPVLEAFRENFATRGEIGAGLVVRRHGRVVVDLWGGLADPATGRAWERDTSGVVFSSTKGMAAAVVLLLVDRGLIALDAPIAELWPAFAQNGKQRITLRMLLNHRSGLSVIDQPLELADFPGPGRETLSDRALRALEEQAPCWVPDTDQGYAACSYGAYVGEIVRRVTGRSLGRVFAEEIAGPLGLDAWIGLPADRFAAKARLIPVNRRIRLRHQIPAMATRTAEGRLFRRVVGQKRTLVGRAFLNPTLGPKSFERMNEADALAIETPWMGGVTTPDALSKLYAALLGEVDGVRLVRPETLRPVFARQSWTNRDLVMQKPLGYSQGFVKDEPHIFTKNPASFGHPGAGGCLGWADPDAGLAIGYVMNHMDWRVRSPRAMALCHALDRCG